MLRKKWNISKRYKAIFWSKAPKSAFYSYAYIKFPEVYGTLTEACTALSPLAHDTLVLPQNLERATVHLASLPPFMPSAWKSTCVPEKHQELLTQKKKNKIQDYIFCSSLHSKIYQNVAQVSYGAGWCRWNFSAANVAFAGNGGVPTNVL